MVGTSEEDLQAQGVDYIVGRALYADNARGRDHGRLDGFLKLIFRRDDMTLLGVHVIGEQATELVHIGLMAMLTGGTAELFTQPVSTSRRWATFTNPPRWTRFSARLVAGPR